MAGKRTQSYVDEAFRQIREKPGILDVIILNGAGIPVRTTLEERRSLEHAGMWTQLMQKSKSAVESIDPEDDVLLLRVRTRQHETIVTPDEKLTIVVVQSAKDQISLEPDTLSFLTINREMPKIM